MRITKDLTTQIVAKLVKPISDKINLNKTEIAKIVQSYVLKDCPKEVLTLWKQKSKWIALRDDISFTYLGQHSRCYLPNSTPCNCSNIVIEDRVIAEKVQSIINDNISLKKKEKELSKEFEVLILKLGTYARIREQFPEAGELLPTEQKMEIALNIQDTRNKLKNLP